MEVGVLVQVTQETLPFVVLRLVSWLLGGFAIALACGLVGVIAYEWRLDRLIDTVR